VLKLPKEDHDMPYLSGVLIGIFITVIAVYLIDHVGSQPDTQDIVNWDIVAQKVGAAKEEVSQEVHKATASKEAATLPKEEAAPPETTSPVSEPPARAPAP
jgi:hypothetical protein